jgi:hypothetical protein
MPSKRLRVLLTFTHEDDHQVEQLGGSVIANLYGNKWFPAPPVDQPTLQTALTDFTTSMAASAQGGIHVTANKNKKRHILVGLLRQLARSMSRPTATTTWPHCGRADSKPPGRAVHVRHSSLP